MDFTTLSKRIFIFVNYFVVAFTACLKQFSGASRELRQATYGPRVATLILLDQIELLTVSSHISQIENNVFYFTPDEEFLHDKAKRKLSFQRPRVKSSSAVSSLPSYDNTVVLRLQGHSDPPHLNI